jgi:hypothetical protein
MIGLRSLVGIQGLRAEKAGARRGKPIYKGILDLDGVYGRAVVYEESMS